MHEGCLVAVKSSQSSGSVKDGGGQSEGGENVLTESLYRGDAAVLFRCGVDRDEAKVGDLGH